MVHVKKKSKKKKKGVLLSRTVRGGGVQRQRRPEHVFVLLRPLLPLDPSPRPGPPLPPQVPPPYLTLGHLSQLGNQYWQMVMTYV